MKRRSQLGIGMTSERTRRRLTDRLREAGIADSRVLTAMHQVPRHLFVDEALASRAYEDIALPIGFGQTISQPRVVARMTDVLLAGRHSLGRVLEVGTGCGYQTAILAALAEEVYTVERIGILFRQARDRLYDLKVRNVHCRHGDGFAGWPDPEPFDSILVAAAAAEIPGPLLDQLARGGRIVMPVEADGGQRLLVVDRGPAGLEARELDAVRFVPLVTGTVR